MVNAVSPQFDGDRRRNHKLLVQAPQEEFGREQACNGGEVGRFSHPTEPLPAIDEPLSLLRNFAERTSPSRLRFGAQNRAALAAPGRSAAGD